MRLIDADALIDRYNREIYYPSTIEEIVSKVPTAYDIDKVVEELKEWSVNATILELHNNELGEYEEERKRDVICTLNAIEIVKQESEVSMRLIDKDKTLEELNGGYKQSLGIIEGSKYSNINDIEDAIDTVKYADEIDISELLNRCSMAFKSIIRNRHGQISSETEKELFSDINAFIAAEKDKIEEEIENDRD